MASTAVLMPLEFKDCLTDSPEFRKKLQSHEKELDRTSQAIKSLTKEIKNLVEAARNLSVAQKNLMCRLRTFAHDPNKADMTEDEIVISQSFTAFAQIIKMVEEERQRMLDRAEAQIIGPLETFRKEAIGGAKERRKKFEKQTQKFYQSQERYLNLSTKKDDQVLQEADASLDMEQRHFVQASLEYVFLLQEVQEKKKFEFVEIILSHTYSWLTFYHQGHDVYNDYKNYMTDLQERIQRTRENFKSTRQEALFLKNKMLEIQDPGSMNKMFTRQGYLFLMEKKAFGTTWTKYYCYYQKETREFRMTSYNQIQHKMEMTLKSCVRRSSDSIDKRFCLDLTVQIHDKEKGPTLQVLTMQTLSEEDCKRWMDAMDGKEPIYSSMGSGSGTPRETTVLDEFGLTFITRAISILESRGLEDQGLYRLVGVSSKVSKLLALGLDPAKSEKLVLEDPAEWEVKTITSAIKQYFRNLPEPLMTYRLHGDFIAAAKQEKLAQRVNYTHHLVYKLPKTNFIVLKALMQHLCNVSKKSDKNLMTVSNLGVCFGPTLLRPEEESVAAIMDIKFCNIVVEILIEHFDKIFNALPATPLELTQPEGGGATKQNSSSASVSSSSTPKSSPTPAHSHSPPSGTANSSGQHITQVSGSKSNQPVLQTVVTSFTTSEPQTVHFGNQQQQQQQQTGPSSQQHQQTVASSGGVVPTAAAQQQQSHGGLLSRSEATSNLKNQANHHSHHSHYHSSTSRPPGGGIPPPPSATHLWAHGGHSASTSSLNSGLISQPSLTSLTSGIGSMYDVGSSTSSSSHNVANTNNSTNNNNNILSNNNLHHQQHHHHHHHRGSSRPSVTGSAPINGRIGGSGPLSFINPLSGTDRVGGAGGVGGDCVGSSSSSCESLSSRSSRDLPPLPPPPQPAASSSLSSSSSPQTSARLGTAYPPTYRQHMETLCKRQSLEHLYTSMKRVRTLYACVGENDSELSFEPNQILTNVRPSKEPGWLEGTLNGRHGLIPENYVEYIDDKSSLPSLISQRNTDV